MRKGSDFERWFKNSASRQGAYVYRFRDAAILAGTNYRYRIPVPSDFLVIKDGRVVFVECKSGVVFTKNRIRDVQIEHGKLISSQKIPYVFLIQNTETGEIFSLIYNALMTIYEEKKGKTSKIDWEELRAFSFYTFRKRGFNLDVFTEKAYLNMELWNTEVIK